MPDRGYPHLLKELARLRAFRDRRRRAIPWRFAWRWYQRRLFRRLSAQWPECYVLLDEGDYFYVPRPLDMHAELLLTQAPGFPAVLSKFCRRGTTAIDVGANIGRWSVPMAKLVGEAGRLIAFEPMHTLADSLRKTFRVNGFQHAEAHELALSDAAGKATLYASVPGTTKVDSGISSLERKAPWSKEVSVATESLDGFLNARTVPPISFIKIDVEGHEARVLAGGQATLRQHRPVLLIETGLESPDQRKTIVSLLAGLDYDPVGIVHDRHIAPATWDAYTRGAPPFEARALNLLLLPS